MLQGMLEGFESTRKTYDGVTRTVHRRGRGPGVLVMHEIPGITPEVARFARRVVDAGFTVAMPEMFGVADKPLSVPYALGQMVRACVSREFHVLAAHGASPITEWLRALARDLLRREDRLLQGLQGIAPLNAVGSRAERGQGERHRGDERRDLHAPDSPPERGAKPGAPNVDHHTAAARGSAGSGVPRRRPRLLAWVPPRD